MTQSGWVLCTTKTSRALLGCNRIKENASTPYTIFR
jgi:hypothetical protein